MQLNKGKIMKAYKYSQYFILGSNRGIFEKKIPPQQFFNRSTDFQKQHTDHRSIKLNKRENAET
jgi:hypothetical protein